MKIDLSEGNIDHIKFLNEAAQYLLAKINTFNLDERNAVILEIVLISTNSWTTNILERINNDEKIPPK